MKYKLSDLTVDGKGTYGIAASAVDFDSQKPTYLRITDINDDGTINFDGLKSVDDENSYKYILKENDIVFARTGASTGRSYFYQKEDGVFVYAGFLIKFSLDPQKVNPRYLKYYTHSKMYYDWVHSFDSGATRGNINAKTFGDMLLDLPERNVQDEIVSILKDIDDKIAVNRRICENLEAQAQALFKHWFIDFAPFKNGNFVESELGMIPEGWRVGTLGEIADLIKPSVKPIENVNYSHYSIPAFDNNQIPSIDNGGTIKSNKFVIYDSVTLLSKLNPEHKRIWFVSKVGPNAICSTEFLPFYSKDREYSPFIYCYLNSWRNYREIANGAKGTTNSHQRIDANAILSRRLAYDKDAIAMFCNLVRDLLIMENKATLESRRLAELRDTLLPKLMSGQIKV